MSQNEFGPIAEESDEIKHNSNITEGTEQYDYAAVLEQLKKEINEIPPKFPGKDQENNFKEVLSDSESSKSGNFQLKKANSTEFPSPREETGNMAYTKSTQKKNHDSEDEYGEDFEDSGPEREGDLEKAENSQEITNNFKNIGKSFTNHNDISGEIDQENQRNSTKQKKSVQFTQNIEGVNLKGKEFNQKVIPTTADSLKKNPEVKTKSSNQSHEAKHDQTYSNKTSVQPSNSLVIKSEGNKRPISSSLPKKEQTVSHETQKQVKQETQRTLTDKFANRPASSSIPGRPAKQNTLAPILNEKNNEKPKREISASKRPATEENFKTKKGDDTKPSELSKTTPEELEDFDSKRKEKKSSTQTNFRITTQKKQNHHDLLKQIFTEFKQKQEKINEQDAKVFALEQTEKRIRKEEEEENKSNMLLEQNWIGNGLGAKPKIVEPISKKPKLPQNPDTGAKSLALKFLANLEKKMGHNTNIGSQKKNNADDLEFKAEEIDGGTQAMAPLSNNTEQPKKCIEAKIEDKQNAPAGKKEGLESTWKYAVGQGILSEYEKTMKNKEQEYKQKFTELFKKEKQKKQDALKQNVQKQKEMLKRERENRKQQQQQFIKTVKAAKENNQANKKENAVLQVQKVYIEENQRDKKEREKIEINDLKNKLKLLLEQNDQLKKSLADLENKESEASKTLDELTSKKAVISLGKQNFTSFGLVPSQKGFGDYSGDSTSTADSQVGSLQEIKGFNEDAFSPAEIIVNKIADQGFTLEQVYQLLDENKDSVLTMKEIKDGFEKLELDLSPKEIQEIISLVDKNTDGVVSMEEFINAFRETLDIRKEYKAIMGDLDKLPNPIILEERTLDLSIRRKVLENELKKLNEEMQLDEKEYNTLVSKLKKYQNLAGPKEEKNQADLENYKETILKLKVELQDLDDLKNRTVLIQNERMSDIMDNVNTLETEINKTIKHIYNEKRKMREKVEKIQKEEIKKIFIEKVYTDLEKEIEKYEQGIDQAVLNMVEEKQIHEKNQEEEETYKNVAFQIQNGAAIKIQKIFRGKVARKAVRTMLTNLLTAKTTILTAFKRFKKKNKGLSMFSRIKKLFINRKKFGFNALKEHVEELRISSKGQQGNMFEIEPNINGTESMPRSQHKKYSLYQIIMMQRILKRYRKVHLQNPGLFYTDVDQVRENCKICEKNPVERVCKICEISLFCKNCFMIAHGRSRPHVFLDLTLDKSNPPSKPQSQNNLDINDLPEKIKTIRNKYKEELLNLEDQLHDLDPNRKGTFDIDELESILAPKITKKEDLKALLDFAIEKCKKTSKKDAEDKSITINYRLLAQFLGV